MKEKFKRIKDKQKFIKLVSDKTACSHQNINNNWFGRLHCGVPKDWVEWVNNFLDTFLEYEKEKAEDDKLLCIKYFENL